MTEHVPPKYGTWVQRGFWNGLPTWVQRGTAVVAAAPEFPRYWATAEGIVGQRIPVVMVVLDFVNAGGGKTFLDDRDGSGWAKVTDRRGSPGYGHRDVVIEPGSFLAETDRTELSVTLEP